MASKQSDQHHLQSSPALVLDVLYCDEEETFDGDFACVDESFDLYDRNVEKHQSLPVFLVEQDLFWGDSELESLKSKEKETLFSFGGNSYDNVVFDGSLMVVRKESVDWLMRVKAHYGFSALTCVLAVNYFDRFICSLMFQLDKPWMGQLTAVACLSLAAKVEETQVPLLLDFQVEESKYVFEAKTIKRMELLVLSTLQWRMNPVTPISYFDHIMRRLGLNSHLHWEFLRKCESLLLSLIAESRFMGSCPSILATAIMMHVIEEVEPCNQHTYRNQLISVLGVDEGKVDEFYKLISELLGSQIYCRKRKHMAPPGSPNGVIDAYFSSDISNDSWSVASSVLSSPVPKSKRIRAQDLQIPFTSLNRMYENVVASPH